MTISEDEDESKHNQVGGKLDLVRSLTKALQ